MPFSRTYLLIMWHGALCIRLVIFFARQSNSQLIKKGFSENYVYSSSSVPICLIDSKPIGPVIHISIILYNTYS